ncbi:hypothetical protein GYMLUDRAFT_677290 [Collybiopsis luxurians FD-317 M1]|uniref:Uncharacterized protein n=1 Tax=Collybiopsis luxurians FD-317 M1 TaxID=944289 RepID=A0A0D0BUX4_9AGAR|nr:hypothetical protein GYMLUDRAFT_677290 [Collybiopsis luxurians FD-317 M1]
MRWVQGTLNIVGAARAEKTPDMTRVYGSGICGGEDVGWAVEVERESDGGGNEGPSEASIRVLRSRNFSLSTLPMNSFS